MDIYFNLDQDSCSLYIRVDMVFALSPSPRVFFRNLSVVKTFFFLLINNLIFH